MSRHVRITLEGVADSVDGGQILRTRLGGANGTLVLISQAWPGVTVEDVTPPRTWTDSDVVQNVDSGRAWVRGESCWGPMDDTAVSEAVQDGTYRVLRYQAGE